MRSSALSGLAGWGRSIRRATPAWAALVSLAEAYFRKWEYTKDATLITKAEDLVRAAVNLNERDAPTHVV